MNRAPYVPGNVDHDAIDIAATRAANWAVRNVHSATAGERSVFERALAIVRDLLICVVCLGLIYAGVTLYRAVGELADRPSLTDQPCLINPDAADCGKVDTP